MKAGTCTIHSNHRSIFQSAKKAGSILANKMNKLTQLIDIQLLRYVIRYKSKFLLIYETLTAKTFNIPSFIRVPFNVYIS